MPDQTNESILFEIKVDSQQYQSEQKLIRESLQQVALDLEKTRKQQKALNDARKEQKLTDAEYAQQSVKLREQLKGQMADQRELEKGLAMSQKAYNAAAGSAEMLRAQLFELKTAYYAMSEAERQTTEGQAIQKQALAISDSLSLIEKSVGTASRDVGKYGEGFKQGLAGVVAELVKAKAAQQSFAEGSEEAIRNQTRVIGFQTEAQRRAAQAGITDFTQAKAIIDQYAQALTPAAKNLVRIQQEQQQVGQTVGENSQQYQELGFKMAGAQKALDDLVTAQVKAEQAAQSGAAAAQQQAAATTLAANSLGGLRQQLLALKEQREALDPTTKEAQELNEQILTLDTRIQQASGKIDALGERIQKNIKKENFDTVSDAIQGLSGATAIATLAFGDNTDAAAAQAKALQLMTIAQSARSIAIGVDSAKEAGFIVLMKVRNLFLKEEVELTAAAAVSVEAHAAVAGADATAIEAQAGAAALNAEAQAAGTSATVASTVATEAQVVATGQATIAQRLLNIAMRLNPIGLIIIAVAALVGAFLAYSNASDKTQAKVRDFTKTLLLLTNPIGLVYLGIEKLYQKFASVRAVLDPLIQGFEKFGVAVGAKAQALGEYIGLLDTAAEKAAKYAAQELAQAEKQIGLYEAQAKAQELAGQRIENVRATQRQGLELALSAQQKANATQAALDVEQLARIAKKQRAQQALSDKEQELLNKSVENAAKLKTAENNLNSFIVEGIELVRAARAQAAADVETNAQRAADYYRRQLDEGIANDKARLQHRLSYLDRQLAAVRINSEQEVELQRKRLATQRDLDLANLGPTLAQERALRAQNLGRILADQKVSEQQALVVHGLTAEQKQHIENEYANKAADTRLAFSTAEAKREVSAREDIVRNANVALTKLNVDHIRQVSLDSLTAEQERANASLALNAKAQAEQAAQGLQATQQQLQEQYQLQRRAVTLERELALASLNTRTDDAAAELRLRAETNRKLAELDAGQADAARQRRAKELSEEARQYDLLADGMLAGHNQVEQQQIAATETYKQQRIAAAQTEQDARLALVVKGSQEEANIQLETENKLKQIRADSAQAQLDLLKAQTEKVAEVITSSLASLSAIQDADSQTKLARIDAEMNKEGVSAARKAVLEKQKLRVEQQAAEQRKKIARAMAVVQLGQAVLAILSAPSLLPSPAGEILKGIEIVAATATAYAQFKAIDSAKFAQGTVLRGPSHAGGGIQLFNRHTGQHMGEAEGGEAIINKRSTAMFGPVLSAINQLGGGRPLYVDPKPASEWARWAEGGVVSSSAAYLPQVRTGGVVQVAAAPINYDLLTDMMAAKLRPAFVAGAQALPPQNVNLTELRERYQQLDQREAETNI